MTKQYTERAVVGLVTHLHSLAKKNTLDFSSAGLVRNPRILGLRSEDSQYLFFTFLIVNTFLKYS